MKERDAPVDLCLKVLRRLDKARVLQDVILVGSWCVYFYREYLDAGPQLSALRTRDMDFLIRRPLKMRAKISITKLLEDLGFIPDFSGDGPVRLSHPELMIDFLVEERGRGSDKPYPVKALGIKAQPLRFIGMLSDDTVKMRTRGMTLVLPHPINFGLQKLIISGRRSNKDKQAKDRSQAVEILRMIVERGEGEMVRAKFQGLPLGWRKAVLASLEAVDAGDVTKTLA